VKLAALRLSRSRMTSAAQMESPPDDDAAPASSDAALLPVGHPVRVKRAGEWLDEWAEILAVKSPPTAESPVARYDVLVKPMIDVTTVSDERGPGVRDGDGNYFRLHTVWYVITDKPYPDEVVELTPETDPDAETKIRAYQKKYEQDGFMRKLYADEKRRTSEVTVRALMNADVERVAAAGPGRVDEVSVPVDVNLYWMKPVLEVMTKYRPTVAKGMTAGWHKPVTFFFHTDKSREAMKNNYEKVLMPSFREGLAPPGGKPLHGGKLYLDGKLLAEDPEKCGFPGYCYEYQHVCVWAVDEQVPFVFVPAGQNYDAEAWKAVHHGRREPPARGCMDACVAM